MLTYTTLVGHGRRCTHLIRDGATTTICGIEPAAAHPERLVDIPYDQIASERYSFVKWCGNCTRYDRREKAA